MLTRQQQGRQAVEPSLAFPWAREMRAWDTQAPALTLHSMGSGSVGQGCRGQTPSTPPAARVERAEADRARRGEGLRGLSGSFKEAGREKGCRDGEEAQPNRKPSLMKQRQGTG